MSCGRGPDCSDNPRSCCSPGSGMNIFDMLHDPCAMRRWNDCKAKIYGKSCNGTPSCNWCTNVSPFPPKRCSPPPPPPRNCCSCHRCNPSRACGFIVKRSNYPGGRPQCCPWDEGCQCETCCCAPGSGGVCSIAGLGGNGDCAIPNASCTRPPKCCPIPDPCSGCCASSCSVHCRPAWRHPALKSNLYCLDPPPLPARSFRYKCWVSQFEGKVDTNLCASRYSSQVDNSGCNMVITEPPDAGCPPCPCHPCCEC